MGFRGPSVNRQLLLESVYRGPSIFFCPVFSGRAHHGMGTKPGGSVSSDSMDLAGILACGHVISFLCRFFCMGIGFWLEATCLVCRGVCLLGMGTGVVFLCHELLVRKMAASNRFLRLCHSHVHQSHGLPCGGEPFADSAGGVVCSLAHDLADVDLDSNADLARAVLDSSSSDGCAGRTIVLSPPL